jgi:hypothetical protein
MAKQLTGQFVELHFHIKALGTVFGALGIHIPKQALAEEVQAALTPGPVNILTQK